MDPLAMRYRLIPVNLQERSSHQLQYLQCEVEPQEPTHARHTHHEFHQLNIQLNFLE